MKMIDLHIHTVFSDGAISDISDIKHDCELFSITDHNSVLAYKSFKENLINCNFVVGCEITIDRAPDILVYFPKNCNLDEIESELSSIRLKEENVIKHCYSDLGFKNWDEDIARSYPSWQKVRNARTRDLAAIIHLYKTGKNYDNGSFDIDDLKVARKQRNKFAETEGNPIPEDLAFSIASKYQGRTVLAHPIHTSIKKCKRDDTTISSVKIKLDKLIDDFVLKGGLYIEWEYFESSSLKKYGLSISDIGLIKNFISDKAKENKLTFTMGSDSHSSENYHNSKNWLIENKKIILDRLAPWVENKLEKIYER